MRPPMPACIRFKLRLCRNVFNVELFLGAKYQSIARLVNLDNGSVASLYLSPYDLIR